MKKLMTWTILLLAFFSILSLQAQADHYRDYYSQDYFYNHPYVKKALIGGGIGAVAGGVIGNHRDIAGSVFKGALIGTAAGTGYEYLRQRGLFSSGRRYYDAYPSYYEHHDNGNHYGWYKHHHDEGDDD